MYQHITRRLLMLLHMNATLQNRLGYKTIFDEESKKKELRGVSASVYPPKPVLDYSLLPPLDLNISQASRIDEIQRRVFL